MKYREIVMHVELFRHSDIVTDYYYIITQRHYICANYLNASLKHYSYDQKRYMFQLNSKCAYHINVQCSVKRELTYTI